MTHWKRPWCWEGLGAGGEGDNRGWDGWMVSPTRWTWVWVNSGSWWWTGKPDVLRFMGSQRVGHDWATELNWWYLDKGSFWFSICSSIFLPWILIIFFIIKTFFKWHNSCLSGICSERSRSINSLLRTPAVVNLCVLQLKKDCMQQQGLSTAKN